MEFKGIPLTMEYLLDWSGYKLKINYRARIKLAQVIPQAEVNKTMILKGKKILQNYRYIDDSTISNRTLPT